MISALLLALLYGAVDASKGVCVFKFGNNRALADAGAVRHGAYEVYGFAGVSPSEGSFAQHVASGCGVVVGPVRGHGEVWLGAEIYEKGQLGAGLVEGVCGFGPGAGVFEGPEVCAGVGGLGRTPGGLYHYEETEGKVFESVEAEIGGEGLGFGPYAVFGGGGHFGVSPTIGRELGRPPETVSGWAAPVSPLPGTRLGKHAVKGPVFERLRLKNRSAGLEARRPFRGVLPLSAPRQGDGHGEAVLIRARRGAARIARIPSAQGARNRGCGAARKARGGIIQAPEARHVEKRTPAVLLADGASQSCGLLQVLGRGSSARSVPQGERLGS